jgi:pyruvate carboxylase
MPNRAAAPAVKVRKAESGNAAHIAAPMPGVVSMVSVTPNQEVRTGDVLLTLEAMKMETVLHAARDGIIGEILVARGTQVDSKDLLIVLR